MSFVLGIDVSSKQIDMVKLAEDSDQATWSRYTLQGKTAFERCRDVRNVLPAPVFYEDVYLIAIETPKTRFMPSAAAMFPVYGAVVASLPQSHVVWNLHPKTWRAGIGLKGNASKDEIAARVEGLLFASGHLSESEWPQDAFDAYAIAMYARENNTWAPPRQLQAAGNA